MVSLSQYILHTMGLKPLPYWKSFWYQTPCRIFSISDVFSDSIHTIQNLKGEMHFHDSENIMVPDKWFDFLEKFWLEKEDAKNKTTFSCWMILHRFKLNSVLKLGRRRGQKHEIHRNTPQWAKIAGWPNLVWVKKTFQKNFFYVFQVLLVAFHCP